MKKGFLFASALFIIFFALFPKSILAKSGCCSYHGGVSYCDTSVGRYVCNDGTYSPSCGCAYIPRVTTPAFPTMNASWKFTPNSLPNKTFTVEITLDDKSPTQYSATLSKCKGCNPGPLTDFYSNKFTFTNIYPGTWYLNVKKSINNTWSTVSYWTVTVPQWYEPTPAPTPLIPTSITSSVDSSNNSLTAGFMIIGILLVAGSGGIYVLYKFIKWFLIYAKEHDGVWTALFWIVIIVILILVGIFSNNKKATYNCNCTKTCPNMTCAEAYFQLNECGCSARDGDGDGVPCEAQCR